MKQILQAAALLPLLMILTTSPAHAYLDPASGSMILQAIVAGIAAVALTLKVYWHKILGLFGGHRSDDSVEADDES